MTSSPPAQNRIPSPLAGLADLMAPFPGTWCLCGGWAVDAWLGRQTREHKDVDLAVFTDDLDAVRTYFARWELIAHDAADPDNVQPWTGRQLVLPSHIHARTTKGDELDLQVNERSGASWVLNREPPIERPLEECIEKCAWGLPALVPEVILFFKSIETRPQDETDFAALMPTLGKRSHRWLREAIGRVRPGHSWVEPPA